MVRDKKRNRFLLVALLLCALLSLACMTITLSAEVTRTNDGKSLISMLWRFEIDREVYRTLQDYSPSSSTPPASMPGWRVTQSDGGRVVDFIMDPTAVERLPTKEWTVTEQRAGNGRTITAKFKPEGGSDPRSQTIQYSITIDERDPNFIRYAFNASIQVTKESSASPFDPPDPKDGAKYAKWQKLDSAIKAAGPGKAVFSITLPGTIEKTNGSTKGNQSSWTFTADKVGTYDMQAASVVRPGGASTLPPTSAVGTRGDCDGDAKITELDALCALEMSTQLRPVKLAMDMDNSGDVSSRDAVIILKSAVGK